METRLKATIAAVLDVTVATIDDDASPETIPAWDSLKQMNIMLAVEDEFGIRFDEGQIANLTSYVRIRQALTAMGIGPS